MANLPHISVVIKDKDGMDTQAELNALSLGYGLHQAWIYAAMFGTPSLFGNPSLSAMAGASVFSTSSFFAVSLVTFALTLLVAGITDQRFLRFYTSKRTLLFAAALTAAGTLAVFGASTAGALGAGAFLFAGIATGIGSGLLILFWGMAFSRCGAATIVANTAVAIVVAMFVYSLLIFAAPAPTGGVIAACLPLLELPLLWKLTPVSYAVRHAVPIFNPLPMRKGAFSVRFAVPVLLFGIALGALRSVSTQMILPSPDLSMHLLALAAACVATVLLLAIVFYIGRRARWDFLFQLVVPLIMAALLFVPLLMMGGSPLSSFVLLAGYMCFEALMWIFLGELCQEFRLSPVFVFGIGRGFLALGSLAGSALMASPELLGSAMPFGESGWAVAAMFVVVVAYALLPRVGDIRRAIAPHISNPAYDRINDKAETIDGSSDNQEGKAPAEEGAAPACRRGAPATGAGAQGAEGTQADGASPYAAGTGGKREGAAPYGGAASPGDGREGTGIDPQGNGKDRPGGAQGADAVRADGQAPSPAADDTAQAAGAPAHEDGAGRPRRGRPSAAEAARPPAGPSQRSGRFRTQCEVIADRYLLSRRETEVLFLLAKGHNAAYVQKKLCITVSTAKTHMHHIYQKLDIHTQQELLEMVAEALEGGE